MTRWPPAAGWRNLRSMRSAGIVALLALGLTSAGAWTPDQATQPPGQPAQGQGAQRQGQGRAANPQQARDRAQTPQGTATIAGRVVLADTGRPVKRARVSASGGGRGMRTTLTDDQGRYRITDLAAGNYTISASKAGYVDGVYGQRRPLQPGTPLALADAQASDNIDIRIMRGGVITGHVGDEDGEPLTRALVTVQRYQYVRGERQLMSAGGDQTDDRGQYRVFGLPPGEYYVSASVSGLGELLGRGLQQLAAGLGGGPGGRGGDPFAGIGAPPDPANQTQTGYAPTYYPGVVSTGEAGKVSLPPGQEVSGIDFQIQLVPLARVTGFVSGAQDVANIMLVPQDASGGLGRLGGQTLVGRAMADGTFTIANVPPGRYTAVARSGGRSGDPRTAMQTVVVNGQNMDGVTLILQPGVTVSGNITVESSGTPAPADYSMFRVDIPDVDPLPGAGPGGRGGRGGFGADSGVQKNGSFSIPNLQPGLHTVRVAGGGAQSGGEWGLKSVTIGGTEVADVPFELKPGQNVDNVTVVLTDRATDLSGTVRDAQGAGTGGLTVIAFATEPQYWRAQSRRISTSRTGASGTFRIRALPAGDYYVLAVDDVEQGEWFDPAYLDSVKGKATRVTLNEGDKKTQDLRGPS
jgi:Carboxypeptidase regulatory-like domain